MTVSDDKFVSRRKAIGVAGAGLAGTTFLTNAFAQGSNHMTPELRDPTKEYPKPPFKKQSQPWPGLAGKMQPPPDHGEKTYKGSGRLAGRKALITGGDSGMGRAAAIAFARDIRVNGVAPGPIWTPLQVSGGASQEKLQKFGSETSLGRASLPSLHRSTSSWRQVMRALRRAKCMVQPGEPDNRSADTGAPRPARFV